MKNLSKFYIAGEWVNPISDNMMPVLNPATEEQIGTVALGNTADWTMQLPQLNPPSTVFA